MLKLSLRRHLEQQYPEHELRQWFDPLTLRADDAQDTVWICFPHALFSQWFMTTVRDKFESIAIPFLSHSLIYEAAPAFQPQQPVTKKMDSGQFSLFSPERQSHANATPGQTDDSGIKTARQQHTFDTFLVNRKNDFPLSVAKKLSEGSTSAAYVPFVIHGPSGCGKTHLLSAMAKALRPAPVFHGGVEDIFNENISHTGSFFIDDMQSIATSPHIQDLAVSLIDASAAENRLAVFAMDTHPSACTGISQKLRQRLISGLVVELKKPDLDIRRQYVQQRSAVLGLLLAKEDMLSLAQSYQDFRTIDGALNKIEAYRSLVNRQPVDLSQILGSQGSHVILTPESIIAHVATHYGVPAEEIPGASKKKDIVVARQTAVFLCRELLGLSLVQIGRIFGNRDHSSIVYIVKKIKELQHSNKDTNNALSKLKILCLSSSM